MTRLTRSCHIYHEAAISQYSEVARQPGQRAGDGHRQRSSTVIEIFDATLLALLAPPPKATAKPLTASPRHPLLLPPLAHWPEHHRRHPLSRLALWLLAPLPPRLLQLLATSLSLLPQPLSLPCITSAHGPVTVSSEVERSGKEGGFRSGKEGGFIGCRRGEAERGGEGYERGCQQHISQCADLGRPGGATVGLSIRPTIRYLRTYVFQYTSGVCPSARACVCACVRAVVRVACDR